VSNEESNIKIDTRGDESIEEQVDTDNENKKIIINDTDKSIEECENEIVENDNKTKKQKINKKIIINK
jgi:hypothetical protein